MGLGGLDVIEPFPRTPCGMPIVPGELRVGQPRLGMRGRDWVGLVEKGMEITDSMCRAGEVGAVPRTGMLEDGGCLVDMTTRERRGKGVNLLLAYQELHAGNCHSSESQSCHAIITRSPPTIMVPSQSSP